MSPAGPKRGELHFVDLDPVVGGEQAGCRPFLVISVAAMNQSRLRMAIGLPVTSTPRDNALHVRLEPSATGLERVSYAMPEMVRSVSTLRFRRRVGRVPAEVLETVARNLGFLVGLGQTKY